MNGGAVIRDDAHRSNRGRTARQASALTESLAALASRWSPEVRPGSTWPCSSTPSAPRHLSQTPRPSTGSARSSPRCPRPSASSRGVVRRLAPASGGLVFETSLAGEVGVPGRSVDSASAVGLAGSARSVLHDAPSIWVALLMESLPRPVGGRPSVDVVWDRPVGTFEDDDTPTVEGIVRTMRWVCG